MLDHDDACKPRWLFEAFQTGANERSANSKLYALDALAAAVTGGISNHQVFFIKLARPTTRRCT